MFIINKIIGFIISILGFLLPVLGVPDSFFNAADTAFSTFANFVRGASFFVPLDLMIMCLTVMLIVDNFALLMRIAKWILSLIRG